MVQYVFANAPATPVTLAGGGINSSVTTIAVATGRGADLPAPGAGEAAILRLEDEYVTYTTRSTDTLTGVTRGFSGSTAASHAAGVEIRNVATKELFDQIAQSSDGQSAGTGAVGGEPANPVIGQLYLPNNGFSVERYSGSAWVPWGPLFPLTTPPNAASWTWANQDGATLTDQAGAVVMALPNTVATGSHHMAVLALPSTPYTITAVLLVLLPVTTYPGAGLCVRDSGAGKLIAWHQFNDPAHELSVDYFNSPTSFSSRPFSEGYPGNPTLLLLRIADDGTNLAFATSADGQNWRTCLSASRTAFLATPDQIGWGILQGSAGGYQHYVTLLSWKQT